MKVIVVAEVQRFMFRQGLQERARYYGVIFLNQMVLNHRPDQGEARSFCCMANNNNNKACQPRLGVCGSSLSSPGRLVLSDLIRAGNRQMLNVRQDHIVPNFIAWLFGMILVDT